MVLSTTIWTSKTKLHMSILKGDRTSREISIVSQCEDTELKP